MKKKKISELPECTSFKGLWTIGVNAFNKSVKVSLEYIQSIVEGMKSATKNATDATSAANSAAQTADNAAQRAQAATTAANTATTNASNATAAAIEAKEDCEEVIAAAAGMEPLNLVPTAMTVEYPSRLLIGNMAEKSISVQVEQNSDGFYEINSEDFARLDALIVDYSNITTGED